MTLASSSSQWLELVKVTVLAVVKPTMLSWRTGSWRSNFTPTGTMILLASRMQSSKVWVLLLGAVPLIVMRWPLGTGGGGDGGDEAGVDEFGEELNGGFQVIAHDADTGLPGWGVAPSGPQRPNTGTPALATAPSRWKLR